jgi:hypothetical protein
MGGLIGLTGLSLALAIVLAVYAWRGWFARYTADDYCTAGLQRALGFLGAQAFWYETWSGRYSYYFGTGLVEFTGAGAAQVLPAIALAMFVIAGAWALWPVAVQHHWPWPALSATLGSAAVVLVCLQGAPQLEQSLYWQTGMLTYLLPLVLMTVWAGWLARRVRAARSPSRRELVFSGVFLFIAAGVAETSLAVQVPLLVLGTALAFVSDRSKARAAALTLLITGLAASLIGAVVVVAAPGNYVHELRVTGSVHGISQLPDAFKAGIDFVGLFARSVQFRARLAVIMLLTLAIWFGMHAARAYRPAATRRDWLVRALLGLGIIACGWLLALAAIVPGYFAQQWDVPERAQLVAVWVLAVMTASAGYLLGESLGQVVRRAGGRLDGVVAGPVWSVALLLLAGAALFTIPTVLEAASADAAYAAEWDALDATIRAAAATGQPGLVDRTLPHHFGFDFLTTEPNSYPNPCVAQFYGLPSIRVLPPGGD